MELEHLVERMKIGQRLNSSLAHVFALIFGLQFNHRLHALTVMRTH